jgi:hypothetical protein
MSDIVSRFTGPHGPRLLTEAFERHRMVGGVKSVASQLAGACQVEVWDTGQAIIEGSPLFHVGSLRSSLPAMR